MAETTEDQAAELAERVKRVKQATDYEAERPVLEHEGYKFGERIRVGEGDDDGGPYSGDEGYLILEEVGAPEYGNVRVHPSIIVDGYDSTYELHAGIGWEVE